MARRALQEAGFDDVIEATNGEEALASLREGHFDLVISDLNMDPVDGLALLTAIRADSALMAMPFILMTGKLEDEDAKLAEDQGVNETMLKPFDPETVREKIERVLGPAA